MICTMMQNIVIPRFLIIESKLKKIENKLNGLPDEENELI